MNSDPNGHSWQTFWQGVKSVFQSIGNWFKGLFGYELRESLGVDSSPNISTGFFGRIGMFSYDTYVRGDKDFLYAFAGKTKDLMNWFGSIYYAGLGINLFNIVGAEIQIETIGVGFKVNIGCVSVGLNINLIGATSIAVSKDDILENGEINTRGVTVGLNTGFLVAVICWIYKFLTIGDASPTPGLQPV